MARLGPSGLAQLFREIANYVSTRLSDYKTKAELDSLLDTKADDNNVVHRTGGETIDGTKTFTSSPWVTNNQTTMGFSIKNTALARNDIPSEYQHHTFRAYDKNDKILGEYCVEKSTNGDVLLNMGVRSEDDSGTQIAYGLWFRMTNDGSAVRFYPSSNNTVDLGMSNHKWAKIYSDDVVHTSGDETIDGNKYFTQDVNVKNSDVDIAVTPSNNLFSCFRFRGKGNVTTASIQYSQRTYGVNDICFYVFDASSNTHGFRIRTDNRLEPIENNTYSLGSSSSKWADVYSTNAYIDRVVCTRFTHSVNNGSVYITGGSEYDKGATLVLHGEESSDAGSFVISSRDKTRTLYLVGKPDGTLQWAGQNIALDGNVVHKTGDEHISGNKIFSNTIHRYADLTTSGYAQVYRFDDTNANACGHIYNSTHWSGDAIFNRHGAYNNKSGKTMEIDIISTDSGVGMAYVSGTATKGNVEAVTSATGHTGIATMGWVNNPATSTNVVHRSGDETIAGNKTFSDRVSFPSGYFIFTDTNDNSLRISRSGSNHGNNYKVIIQGNTGKFFAPNGFIGNLQGNADTATKSSYLDNYSLPGGNKIYLDWDTQRKGYVGLKVDKTTMGGLITTDNIGSQGYVTLTSLAGGNRAGSLSHSVGSLILASCSGTAFASTKSYANVAGLYLYPCRTEIYTMYNATGYHFEPIVVRYSTEMNLGSGTWRYLGGSGANINNSAGEVFGMFLRVA